MSPAPLLLPIPLHTHAHTHTRTNMHARTHTHTQVWRYDGTVECYTEGHLPLAIWAGTVLAIYTLFSLLIPISIHVLLAVVSAQLKGQQWTHICSYLMYVYRMLKHMTVYIHRGKGMIILYVVCDLNQNEVYKESVTLYLS